MGQCRSRFLPAGILAVLCVFAGCAKGGHGELPVLGEMPGASEWAVELSGDGEQEPESTYGEEYVLVPDDPQEFRLYIYGNYSKNLAEEIHLPLEGSSLTAAELANLVEEHTGEPQTLSALYRTENGVAAVFDGGYQYDVFLSYWATILENCAEIEKVRFVEGSKPITNNGTDEEGYLLRGKVHVLKTPEEYAALRAQLSYEPAEGWNSGDWDAMTRFVNNLWTGWSVYPEHSFSSAEEAPQEFLRWCAVNGDQMYISSPQSDAQREAYEQLELCVNGFTMFCIQENVELAAARLFGEDLDLEHGDAELWEYLEVAGIYIPKFYDGPVIESHPEILVRRELEDGLHEIEVVFVYRHFDDDEGVYQDEDGRRIDDVAQYRQEVAERHTITLRESGDGGYHLVGYILPGDRD